jgi:dephospho-CoA kinase
VKRVLLTGVSGTGKSSVCRRLRDLGHRAVDTDDDWPRWVVEARTEASEPDWLWREDLIDELLDDHDGSMLFVSGCRSNQALFYPRFDYVVLLTAPVPVIVQRLSTRATNDYGKDAEELRRILREKQAIEPLLRRRATLELDTTAPLDDIVAAILRHVEA